MEVVAGSRRRSRDRYFGELVGTQLHYAGDGSTVVEHPNGQIEMFDLQHYLSTAQIGPLLLERARNSARNALDSSNTHSPQNIADIERKSDSEGNPKNAYI